MSSDGDGEQTRVGPPQGKKTRAIAIDALLLAGILLMMFVALSLTYSDSYNPLSLFAQQNRNFSYGGMPLSANLYSAVGNYMQFVPRGAVTLSVTGKAQIDLYPNKSTAFRLANGTVFNAFPGPVRLVSSNDADFGVYMQPEGGRAARHDSFYLHTNRSDMNLVKKKDYYELHLYCPERTLGQFSTSFVPGYLHKPADRVTVHVRGGQLYLDGGPEMEGDLDFYGDVSVTAPDEGYLVAGLNDTLFGGMSTATIRLADGSLVVPGKSFPCYGADNIRATSAQAGIFAGINSGRIYTGGTADSLIFRNEQYIVQPVSIFLTHDLSLTFATGSIIGILMLILSRIATRIRKGFK